MTANEEDDPRKRPSNHSETPPFLLDLLIRAYNAALSPENVIKISRISNFILRTPYGDINRSGKPMSNIPSRHKRVRPSTEQQSSNSSGERFKLKQGRADNRCRRKNSQLCLRPIINRQHAIPPFSFLNRNLTISLS